MLDTPRWTPEREERLRKLHSEGFTFGAISLELGGVTRNAVIGKAKRMGLLGKRRRDSDYMRHKAAEARKKPAVPKPVKAAPEPARTESEARADPQGLKILKSDAWKPLPGSEPVPFSEATGCRWMMGEDARADTPTCNLPIHKDHFCKAHHALAYTRGLSE